MNDSFQNLILVVPGFLWFFAYVLFAKRLVVNRVWAAEDAPDFRFLLLIVLGWPLVLCVVGLPIYMIAHKFIAEEFIFDNTDAIRYFASLGIPLVWIVVLPWFPWMPFVKWSLFGRGKTGKTIRRGLSASTFNACCVVVAILEFLCCGHLFDHLPEGDCRREVRGVVSHRKNDYRSRFLSGKNERSTCFLCRLEKSLGTVVRTREKRWVSDREAICIPDWARDYDTAERADDCGANIAGGE